MIWGFNILQPKDREEKDKGIDEAKGGSTDNSKI